MFGTGANVHPIHDVATAAAGAVNGAVNGVKKAMGIKDASASSTSSSNAG